jgi:O-antigen/teichoic acid export membrane protein
MKKVEFLSILNRAFGLISALLLVILNLHFVHVEGQGTIALINFGILIVATLSQFIGGGALIYLIPRIGEQKIALPSLLWIAISAALTSILLSVLNAPFILFTILLGVLQSIFVLQQMILLGKEKIESYQILLFTQSVSSLTFVACFYFTTDWGIMAFIFGQLLSFLVTASVGFFLTPDVWKKLRLDLSINDLRQTAKLGGYAQLGNIFHLGNQRSYLYFLENSGPEGKIFTGVFSILMYVAEALWSVVKSLSSILASRVAQSSNLMEHIALTQRYLILGVSTTVFGTICFLLIPNTWLAAFVDYDIAFLKEGFFFLIPGIIANTVTVSYAHLFSGRGLHQNNFYSALIGFSIAILCSSLLIPTDHLNGACIAASAAFVSQSLVQIFLFFRLKKKELSI